MIATTRIIMPNTVVRFSAGRNEMSASEQAFYFLAGANSIFVGSKLLTTRNPDFDDDSSFFELLGLLPKVPNNRNAA
jgi:biotin synthase